MGKKRSLGPGHSVSALALAAALAAAFPADAAELRLERRGDALEAFSGGRRFAVL